jgi:hypothetical protein
MDCHGDGSPDNFYCHENRPHDTRPHDTLKAVGLLIFQKPSFKSRSRQVYVLPGF